MKNKYINNENSEALILLDKIKKLESKYFKLRNNLEIERTKLQEICIHNETEKNEDYISGGYLDRAEYITRIICKTCGKMLDKQIKYGGFG